jgi:aspartokinase
LEKLDRIKIGGLKVLEEGACVQSSSPQGDNCGLGSNICEPLARDRINLSYLTYLAGDRQVLCTAGNAGGAALSLLQSHAEPASTMVLKPATSILAVYPHNQRPEVLGTFIRSLAGGPVTIHGLASSPSAITAVLPAAGIPTAVDRLFEHFHFPGFASPQEFFSAQPPPQEYLEKVVATYQEKVIKVYCIVPRPDLDLWTVSLPAADLVDGCAPAFTDLEAAALSIPFLVALPEGEGEEFTLSFSTVRQQAGDVDHGQEVRRILKRHLPQARPQRLTPVAGLFLHGPHFGDRFGIAHTLVEALEKAHIPLLALSCTISSISLIIHQQELAAAQVVLTNTFAAPVQCSTAGD